MCHLSLALLSVCSLCLYQGGQGQEASGERMPLDSVPVVLLLTETGATQEGVSQGATAAPTSQHEEDNSLGYTGTDFAACTCSIHHHPSVLYLPMNFVSFEGF